MFKWKICSVRRGVCTAADIGPIGEKRDFRKPTDLPITDPRYFWVETQVCGKQLKTWRDMEEDYKCAMLSRFAMKTAPERRFFNIESGDLYICRRGCMQPCLPPPCFDPDYPSFLENALYRFRRFCALAVFFLLVYGSNKLKIWGPSGPTLDTVLGDDSDQMVDQLGEVNNIAIRGWNYVVGVMFEVIKYIFPAEHIDHEFNERDFIMDIQDELKERKEREEAAIVKDDENVFEEWELVYKYEAERGKLTVETVDDADWLWMDHDDPKYVKSTKANMPYESTARELKELRDQDGVTLASIYTDFCAPWTVTKGADEEEDVECDENSPLGQICKRKRERRFKTKINPNNCNTCPLDEKKDDDDSSSGNPCI